MRVLAYVDRRYVEATRKVVGRGAVILTSPPYDASEIEPETLEGYDVIYLDLHGVEGGAYLYAGREQEYVALGMQTVREADLRGTVVVATTCYLPRTMFVRAFLDAGAAAVVGGDGPNYGTRRRLSGAQVLARLVLGGLRQGWPVMRALERAQRRLRWSLRRVWDRRATVDALGFRIHLDKEIL